MTSMTVYSNIGKLSDKKYHDIKVKDIQPEVFQDYKKCSLFIGVSKCDFKCCKEVNLPCSICQNSGINNQKDFKLPFEEVLKTYSKSLLNDAIVIGGLEPFLQVDEVYQLCKYLRKKGVYNDIVIYTGYYQEEICPDTLKKFKELGNIIIKFGRYIPDRPNRFDEVLGITLSSDNQYAVKL